MNWKDLSINTKLFIDDNQKSLTTQHDHTKCNLGKWLYGEGRKKAVADMPEIAGHVKEMEESHKRLHASVAEINKIIVILCAVSLVVVITLSFFISRMIVKVLDQAVNFSLN